jgi:universal stress protein E
VNHEPAPHPYLLRYAERDAARNVIQKILVVVAPTAQAHPCIDKAARLAASFGSTIELFVCDGDQELPVSWAGGTTTAQYRGLMRERRVAALERLADPLRARGLSITTDSKWHAPLEEGVVEHAIRIGADLVIKDAQRHRPTARMPVERTDWILIRQVPVPLLLVRPTAWPACPRVAVSVDPCRIADRPVALDEAMVALGCSIGRALNGPVEVLHALQSPPHLAGEALPAEVREQARARDREAVERLADRNSVGHAAVRFTEQAVPQGILELAATAQPSILVVGAAGRPRFRHPAASTAAQLLDQLACDVLVVKPPGFVSPVLVSDT